MTERATSFMSGEYLTDAGVWAPMAFSRAIALTGLTPDQLATASVSTREAEAWWAIFRLPYRGHPLDGRGDGLLVGVGTLN